MSDHYRASIENLQAELRPLEEKVVKTKQLINLLCEHAGIPPIYPAVELAVGSQPTASRGDEFYNKPLNTSIKAVLAHRKQSGRGPLTAEELLDALLAGGYDKFPSDRNDALNGLRISLGKSSHTFVKLPNGTFGLAEWYNKKPPKTNGKTDEKPGEKPDEKSEPTLVEATVGAVDETADEPEESDEAA